MAPVPPKLPDRSTALTRFLTNLALPGVGLILAGRRVVGALQLLLALVGFALSVFWFVAFVALWIRTREFPATGGPYLWVGIFGVMLFGVAWFWAFVTGLGMFRPKP